jgi:two-component system response regulator PilR (NtrC family)
MATRRGSILLVDDEEKIVKTLGRALRDAGHDVVETTSARAAQRLLAERTFDLLIVDNVMPELAGLDLIRELVASSSEAERPQILMMTAHATVEGAIDAMKLGALDYLQKPFEIDELLVVVRRALEHQRLRTDYRYLLSEQNEQFGHYGIIGRSRAMEEVVRRAERVAETKSTVLITGETGTGKELIARAIHYNSTRRGKFVSINCGALPETLLESELFGHERGAFTGAIREKRGLFQEADRGTIFLDEIGETSTAMQIKLLRVLQERLVRKVGANNETGVDVRVLAATNRDLTESIRNGTFREDLFYRINVIPIELPPLRQRREDIPLLVDHFIGKFSTALGIGTKKISTDAMRAIEKYHWPGNVRELENVIERMIALDASDVLTTKSLPEHILLGGNITGLSYELPPEGLSLEEHLESIGKIFMLKALERTGGVQTQAAELLRMSFRSFRYYAKKYDLIPRDTKAEDVAEVESET